MPKITPQEAVQKAAAYLTAVTGITSGLSVEEVQLSEDHFWLITIGHPEANPQAQIMVFSPTIKAYKQIKLNADTGEVVSMTIRKI